jgi:hypothetical protein
MLREVADRLSANPDIVLYVTGYAGTDEKDVTIADERAQAVHSLYRHLHLLPRSASLLKRQRTPVLSVFPKRA